MKKLLNTLYVTTEDTFLSLENENVLVSREGKPAARFPLQSLEGIVYFGYKGASPQLMGECVSRGIDFVFLSGHGRFRARLAGSEKGNVYLRKEQYATGTDKDRALAISRNMILGKVFNARWTIERALRDHETQVDTVTLRGLSAEMSGYVKAIPDVKTEEELRGIEGSAARAYYKGFGQLVLANRADFVFVGRSKRPPKDRVNAMCSLAYTLLASNCASALESVGLDPYAGVFHKDRPGRKSLALDLEEELRSVMADRVVLNCINRRMISPNQFDFFADGAVYLNEKGRRIFLEAWQKKRQEVITHPFLNEKVEWGMVPYVQASLLARHLRGDMSEYPPFLWK